MAEGLERFVAGIAGRLDNPLVKAAIVSQVGAEGWTGLELLMRSFELASKIDDIGVGDLMELVNLFGLGTVTGSDLRIVGARMVMMGLRKEMQHETDPA